MPLPGQGSDGLQNPSDRPHLRLDAEGFTMVVLLVVMAVMAVGMSALLPTWRQQAIREKEEELVFRGNQYARALVLYSRKNNNQLPQNVDVLVSGKYLRKKYKDPITGDDFGLIGAGEALNSTGRGGTGQPGGRAGGASSPGSTGSGRAGGTGSPGGNSGLSLNGQRVVGSIQGVYSKSTDTSIRKYREQQRYIDWPFNVQYAQIMMGGARVGGAANPAGGRRSGGPVDLVPIGRGGGGRGGGGRGGLGDAPPGGRGGGRGGATTPPAGGRGGGRGGG